MHIGIRAFTIQPSFGMNRFGSGQEGQCRCRLYTPTGMIASGWQGDARRIVMALEVCAEQRRRVGGYSRVIRQIPHV